MLETIFNDILLLQLLGAEGRKPGEKFSALN